MSYIIKQNDPLINVKLTNLGRRNLSSGSLSFVNFSLGDGEMDYTNQNPDLVEVLRPMDNQHDIQYPVPSSSNVFLSPINIITSVPTVINAPAKIRGFFNYTGNSTYTGGTVYNLTGTTSASINKSLCTAWGITGSTSHSGSTISLKYTSSSLKNMAYKSTIDEGDYIFLKFKTSGYTSNYTAPGIGTITPDPVTYLMYSIQNINGLTSFPLTGYTSGTKLNFTLDRELPAYSCYKVEGFIYPGSNTISDYYDNPTPLAYWSNGLLDFTSNCTLSTDDVPVWNMNIINIEDVIGLDETIYKGRMETVGKNYWGTAINYDYFLNISLNKVGVIHYTNNSVSNFYAEGFYNNTLQLNIPYIMWHKKQFGGVSMGDTMGYTFVCDTNLKTMGSSNTILYYDLIDQEEIPTVVGKVLINEKIILIEDQELLTVLSFKANRNWTLPKPILTFTNPGVCYGASSIGSVQPNQTLHATYLFLDTSGTTGMHCEAFTSIVNTGNTPQDVLFQFPFTTTGDPTYTEFNYLMNYNSFNGVGFRVNSIYLLWQITPSDAMPSSADWSYYNINNYVGTNGCLEVGSFNSASENFQLYEETVFYSMTSPSFTGITIGGVGYSLYELTQNNIGDILVASGGTLSGKMLVQATSTASIGIDGMFSIYSTTGATTVIAFKTSTLTTSALLQFSYLTGVASTTSTIREDILVPSIPTLTSYNYTNGIYYSSPGVVSLTLFNQPNNDVVWVFYNGQLISANNYGVYTTGTTANRRVQLNFTPAVGSDITLYYLDNSGLGTNPINNKMTPANINNLRVNIDKSFLDNSVTEIYNLNDFISIPLVANISGFTFGDEVFFFGNISTNIQATIYKSLLTCNVLPNQFINSANPTFNPDENKASYTEIGIYDGNNDLVAIGKFSEPLVRKYNSDMLIIQATIDF